MTRTILRWASHVVVVALMILAVFLSKGGGTRPVAARVALRTPTPILGRVWTDSGSAQVSRLAAPLTTRALGPRQDTAVLALAAQSKAQRQAVVTVDLSMPTRGMLPQLPKTSVSSMPVITITRAAAGGNPGAGWVNVRRCSVAPPKISGTGEFRWPTNSHIISGYSYSPSHLGIDLSGNLADPVYAADTGMVVWAGPNPAVIAYGIMVVLDHGNGWQTLYAHLNSIYASCEQPVLKGTVIGAMGTTGRSSGPHLHFEMWHNGELPDPTRVLPKP